MKWNAAFVLLLIGVTLSIAEEKAPDLTGADAKTFKASVGKTITLRGMMTNGKLGLALSGTPDAFYVIPEASANGKSSYSKEWTSLLNREVEITGELKFQSYPKVKLPPSPTVSAPLEHYYMVQQKSEVRAIDKK